MNLLDFPPEIFGQIIGLYVTDIGVLKAWDRRGVCKTWDAYIKEEIFANRSVEEFARRNSSTSAHGFLKKGVARKGLNILKNGMHLYLEYRSITLSGKNLILPFMVRNITDIMVLINAKTGSGKSDRDVLRDVAQAVALHCPHAYSICVQKQDRWIKKVSGDDVKQNALCVAVALKCEAAIHHLIADGASIWHHSVAFGSPLKVAFTTQDLNTLHIVLHYTQSNQVKVHMRSRRKVWEEAIMELYWKKDDQIDKATLMPILIPWHLEKLVKIPLSTVGSFFLDWCIRARNIALLERLLTHGAQSWHSPSTYFDLPPDPDVLQILLAKNVVDLNGSYRKSYEWDTQHIYDFCSVLEHAAYYNEEQIIRKAFDMGAHPDGVVHGYKSRYTKATFPLRIAVLEGNQSATKLLLELGADPESQGPATPPAGTQCNLVHFWDHAKEKSTWPLFLCALQLKIVRLGADYKIPEGHETCYNAHLPYHLLQLIYGHRSLGNLPRAACSKLDADDDFL